MRVGQIKSQLKEDLENITSERVEARHLAQALAEIEEEVNEEEIQWLVAHTRFPLRTLACELVYFHDLKESLPLLIPLLSDSRPEVTVSALTVLVLMREDLVSRTSLQQTIKALTKHADPAVKITAAWGLILMGDAEGELVLKTTLKEGDIQTQRLASGAVATLGEKGLFLALEAAKYEDPFVQATLAWACLQQRVNIEEASSLMMTFLEKQTQTISWDQQGNPIFRRFNKSQERHHPFISNYPKVVDQVTRLNILNLLVIVEYPLSQTAMKNFLKERQWHISGMAALILLEEGDTLASQAVEQLLDDEDSTVRLNAALLLALWGKEQRVIPFLEEAYPSGNRWQKIQILDAIGTIGSQGSKKFLLSALSEPSQMLRLVSASALIRCLRNGS